MAHHKIVKIEVEFEVPAGRIKTFEFGKLFKPRGSVVYLNSKVVSSIDKKTPPVTNMRVRSLNEFKRITKLILSTHRLANVLTMRGSGYSTATHIDVLLNRNKIASVSSYEVVVGFTFKETVARVDPYYYQKSGLALPDCIEANLVDPNAIEKLRELVFPVIDVIARRYKI